MPVDAAAAARVQKAGSFLKWQDDSLCLLKQDVWLLVPPVAVRREVIEERHVLLRHAGVNKLLASLRGEFWWSSMAEDVGIVVKECDSC